MSRRETYWSRSWTLVILGLYLVHTWNQWSESRQEGGFLATRLIIGTGLALVALSPWLVQPGSRDPGWARACYHWGLLLALTGMAITWFT